MKEEGMNWEQLCAALSDFISGIPTTCSASDGQSNCASYHAALGLQVYEYYLFRGQLLCGIWSTG